MDSPSELEGAVSPTASLRSDLEGELLRAVRLELCLAGWGRHFFAEQGSGSGSEFLGPPVGTGQLVKSGKVRCLIG